MTKSTEDWIYRWKNWVKPTETPGLYCIRDGGFLYRRMVTDPATGKEREVKRVLRDADEATAAFKMQEAVLGVKNASAPVAQPKTRFAEYANDLHERKLKIGDFKSNATIKRWDDTQVHLLDTTEGRQGRKVLGLGEVFIHMLEKPIQSGMRDARS